MGANNKAFLALDLSRPVSDSITRPANTTAYAAGDAVSDTGGDAHFAFVECLHRGLTSGEIVAARITSTAGGVGTALDAELWLFHTDVTAVADNASWTLSDAQALTRVAIIEFPTADWRLNANNCTCDVYPNQPFSGIGADRTLYGQLVARNAYNPTSGETFTVELVFANY